MTRYSVSLVARIPRIDTPPDLVEVDRLIVDSISYSDELNKAGSAALSCPVQTLSSTVKDRLRDLRATPSEVWVYRGTQLRWAGEVQTVALDGQAVKLGCVGLFGYTSRMGIIIDLSFSHEQHDQFVIAKGLVDHWQARQFGHYGIDTSGIGFSGVTRDRTYLAKDLLNIGTKLSELAAVEDGFDLWVDPLTRQLLLAYPHRGADLSATVFFDRRNIQSAAVAMSVAPADLVSYVSAVGTNQGDNGVSSSLSTTKLADDLLATFGASWAGRSFDGVTRHTTLDGHATAMLTSRSTTLFQPGVSIRPIVTADVGDFAPGDTVSYSYDAGLGYQSGTFRLVKVAVTVDEGGDETMAVEFA